MKHKYLTFSTSLLLFNSLLHTHPVKIITNKTLKNQGLALGDVIELDIAVKKAIQNPLELLHQIEADKLHVLKHIKECNNEKCPLNRRKYPEIRNAFTKQFIDNFKQYNNTQEHHNIVFFASRDLFQELIVLFQLNNAGFKNLTAHFIDLAYEDESLVNNLGNTISISFNEVSTDYTFKFYKNSDDFLNSTCQEQGFNLSAVMAVDFVEYADKIQRCSSDLRNISKFLKLNGIFSLLYAQEIRDVNQDGKFIGSTTVSFIKVHQNNESFLEENFIKPIQWKE